LKPKKKPNKTPKTVKDFSLEDILNAHRPQTHFKHLEGIGCSHCGSTKVIDRGEVKVFRGHRMVLYHCWECKHDFYKEEM
jgi:hypothetical protein